MLLFFSKLNTKHSRVGPNMGTDFGQGQGNGPQAAGGMEKSYSYSISLRLY
jgi:hypothetical protein